MTARTIIAAVALATLSACTYPELASFPAMTPVNPAAPTDLEGVLQEASRLQGTYASGYKNTALAGDLSNLPIIGAAGAAAWVLLMDKSNAAQLAGKIGIGAGVYATARGQFLPAGLPDAYIAGYGALDCVLAEGPYFAGGSAQARYRAFDTALGDLADQIAVVQALIAQPPQPAPAAGSADEKNLAATRELAKQAITQALAGQQTSLTQLGAYYTAPQVFRNAVSIISVRVATRGRARPAIDFATLRDSFAAAPKDAADASEHAQDDATVIQQNLIAAMNELLKRTTALQAATPGYKESLARVVECPKLVS